MLQRIMEMAVYRNLSAIRFIRCVTPVPGANINAGGAGFTVAGALTRCQSELIERGFEIRELRPAGIKPIGIAAHLTKERAFARARQEAAETLCLRAIKEAQEFRCLLKMRIFGITLGIAKTAIGYFCLIRGNLSGRPVAAHSAAPTAFGALLKTWEEYQSLRYFRPEGAHLKAYTKANMIFSEDELAALPFIRSPGFVYRPDLSALQDVTVERSGRVIVYFVRNVGEP